MLDNSSTSSLPSLLDERPERRKHQGWRKPVPKFIPDPPKRQSLLSNSSALRRMALLTSGDDRPPLPANWKENIEKALTHEQLDVERPSSPTPDAVSNKATRKHNGVTLSSTSAERTHREGKALPVVPHLHEAKRHSDAESTLVGSIQSMKLEASDNASAATSIKSLHHGRARSLPTIKRESPPPAGTHNERRHTDGEWEQVYVQDAAYRIVYPRAEKGSSRAENWRRAAVFPVFSGSATDVSIDVTAIDSTEYLTSLHNQYPSTDARSLTKPGASSMHDTTNKCRPLHSTLEHRSKGLRHKMKHTLREWFCLNASPAKY